MIEINKNIIILKDHLKVYLKHQKIKNITKIKKILKIIY